MVGVLKKKEDFVHFVIHRFPDYGYHRGLKRKFQLEKIITN